MSNWTVAALLAGTGAATVALAHHSFPGTATAAGTTAAGTTAAGTTAAGTTAAGTTAAAAGPASAAAGPQVAHSVASTSPSGVVTTTTTHVVNGQTVVTRARHVPAYHDN